MITCIRASPPQPQTVGTQTAHYTNDGHVIELSDQLNKGPHHPNSTSNSLDPIFKNTTPTLVQRQALKQPQRWCLIFTKKTIMSLSYPTSDREYPRLSLVPKFTTVPVAYRQVATAVMTLNCSITHHNSPPGLP